MFWKIPHDVTAVVYESQRAAVCHGHRLQRKSAHFALGLFWFFPTDCVSSTNTNFQSEFFCLRDFRAATHSPDPIGISSCLTHIVRKSCFLLVRNQEKGFVFRDVLHGQDHGLLLTRLLIFTLRFFLIRRTRWLLWIEGKLHASVYEFEFQVNFSQSSVYPSAFWWVSKRIFSSRKIASYPFWNSVMRKRRNDGIRC